MNYTGLLEAKRSGCYHSIPSSAGMLYGVEEILANDDLPRLLVMGMLPIGCAANGDLLVLQFSEENCARELSFIFCWA